MFASRMGVRAIARNGMFGNSKNTCISGGAQNSENAIDIGLHELEGLGGCTTQPSWFDSNGDHCQSVFWKKGWVLRKVMGKDLFLCLSVNFPKIVRIEHMG